jgi:hypothetical protein
MQQEAATWVTLITFKTEQSLPRNTEPPSFVKGKKALLDRILANSTPSAHQHSPHTQATWKPRHTQMHPTPTTNKNKPKTKKQPKTQTDCWNTAKTPQPRKDKNESLLINRRSCADV